MFTNKEVGGLIIEKKELDADPYLQLGIGMMVYRNML
jgi:hypothetical protein